jgi:aspartate kinase
MARIVQKFGGSSLASIEKIRQAAAIAVDLVNQGHEVTTVVSAMGKTTDLLISMAEEISATPDPRELDMLLATGEQQTIALMAMAIEELGAQARSFTGYQAGILTESQHGAAKIREIDVTAVESALNRGEVAVVAGFQGTTTEREITTLGRGGSDTTAVALAASLGAERCDIYTDVLGVFTADPHLVPDAKQLSCISYEEMFELANTGAKVLNARSVEMAMESHVPVRVRSTFEPEKLGTLITHKFVAPEYTICGITADKNISCFSLSIENEGDNAGPLEGVASIFTRLAELSISTDMVMLLALEDEPIQELVFMVEKHFATRVRKVIASFEEKMKSPALTVDDNLARISIIGRRLTGKPEVVASVFDVLNQAHIPIHLVATGDLRMSVLVPLHYADQAVQLIHDRFNLSEESPAFKTI